MTYIRIFVANLILLAGLVACNSQNSPKTGDIDKTPVTESPLSAFPKPTKKPTETPSPTKQLFAYTATKTLTPLLSPTYTLTPTKPTCLSEGGRIEIKAIQSKLLPKRLTYRVYTPPCYDQTLNQDYPVLYLIHGQTYNDDQWDRLGVDETADALIKSAEIPPLLIIMPRDRIWKQPPENNFGKAVISDLVPIIDASYRTIPERKYRAIGGLSWGANWAIHLGLTNWRIFGSIGAHSLPVFSTDGPRLSGWLDAIPSNELPRIYLDAGDHDRWLQYTQWFEDLLTQKGIPHEWHLYPGYHNEDYWSSHVEDYLRWYTQDW
ncbi:MAG: hypothetical protein J7L73_03115 [Anaerolineales bacterium]|nr:hypothetical protein [Anaerolineales bacterium]